MNKAELRAKLLSLKEAQKKLIKELEFIEGKIAQVEAKLWDLEEIA